MLNKCRLFRHSRDISATLLWSILIMLCLASSVFAISDGAVDLMFVIDNSGSMRKNDPDFMTPQTVRTFLDQLSPKTRVGMVLFDEKARLLQPLSDLSNLEAKKRLVRSLDRIDYKGQYTNSAAGLERAVYELKTSDTKEAQKCIIFLTDGIVDTGQSQKDIELTQWLKNDLTSESRNEGIRIFGIAFTENADFILIQALSSRTDGAYYRAYKADDIAGVLNQIQEKLTPPPPPKIEPIKPLPPIAETPPPKAAVNSETAPLPQSGEVSRSVDSGVRSFWKYYLPLVAIIFLLIGLLLFLVHKLFGLPSWVLRQRPGNPTSEPQEMEHDDPTPPDWQLQDLDHKANPVKNFNTQKISIGRDEKNDLVIPHPTVSNFHATIEYKEKAFYLEDQRSTNGTRLNDRQIQAGQAMRLKSGDRITFANFEYKFVRLDQLISGDTVMMSVTAFDTANEIKQPASSTWRNDDERNLKASLENHLAQIKTIGIKYSNFVDRFFSDDIIRTLSIQASENMKQTISDGEQQCSPMVKGNAFYVVCTLPVPIAETVEWFKTRYGGFTQFIFKWIRSEAYDVTACDVFCITTFGIDQGPWVSMTIVPTRDADNAVEIMSVDFLSEAEKASLALDFDDHGRVI